MGAEGDELPVVGGVAAKEDLLLRGDERREHKDE